MDGGSKNKKMEYRKALISEISLLIQKPYKGKDIQIEGLGLCNRNSYFTSILSYIVSEKYLNLAIKNKSVKSLFLKEAIYQSLSEDIKKHFTFILSDYPEEDFYKVHQLLYSNTNFYEKFEFDPIIGEDCQIHPTVIIESGVVIGKNVTIAPYSVINRGSEIGNNCRIGSFTVIGSKGFQILRDMDGHPYNIFHVGGTKIGNNVWIGDHVTICNSIFEDAVRIGSNTCIDSHCYVAHNCIIQDDCVLTAGVLQMGSSQINTGSWIAPGSIILNRILVDSNTLIGAGSLVNKDIQSDSVAFGIPVRFQRKIK